MPTTTRRIEPELLDEAPPEEAERSLRDLVRINRLFGGHEALRRTLREDVRAQDGFTMLDIGAASGDMGAAVRAIYPHSRVTSLDYRDVHLRRAAPPRVVADAFSLPFRHSAFDYVHCSLFLHHFTDQQVIELLRGFGHTARLAVVLTDLERHWIAERALPWTRWLFGWHDLTLHDGPISVRAGWTDRELRAVAEAAGATNVRTRRFRKAFRIAMVYSAM